MVELSNSSLTWAALSWFLCIEKKFNYLYTSVLSRYSFFLLVWFSSYHFFSSILFSCRCKEGYRGLRCDQFVPKTDPILSNPSMFFFMFIHCCLEFFRKVFCKKTVARTDIIKLKFSLCLLAIFSNCLCQWWNNPFLTLEHNHVKLAFLLFFFFSLRICFIHLKMLLFCKTSEVLSKNQIC